MLATPQRLRLRNRDPSRDRPIAALCRLSGIVAHAELRFRRRGPYDMAMPEAFEKWTVDLLDALPESTERFELIGGELYVTPSPALPHQRAVLELSLLLGPYTKAVGNCELVISPSDVWREPRQENRVQPDLYVVRLRDGKAPRYPFHLREQMLAIQVAITGLPLLDYQVKRRLYASEGVAEYWVVNLEERNVTRWRGTGGRGEVVTGQIEWRPSAGVDPLLLELPVFFDEAMRSDE
jgi:Uma2 family endonuclease